MHIPDVDRFSIDISVFSFPDPPLLTPSYSSTTSFSSSFASWSSSVFCTLLHFFYLFIIYVLLILLLILIIFLIYLWLLLNILLLNFPLMLKHKEDDVMEKQKISKEEYQEEEEGALDEK